MNLKVFFDNVRDSVFTGRMSQSQVDGCLKIIEYRDAHWPKMVDAELAYVLATAEWETGHSLQPVEEGFPLTGDALRAYQRKLRYWPWYGRGLVQITWERNYKAFGIEKAEDALKWDVALRCLFEGCIKGMFTGKKLADYITAKRQDYVNARRIVNGLDKAEHIAKNARAFHAALLKSSAAAIVSKPMPELSPDASRRLPTPPVSSMWDRIAEAIDKIGAQPAVPAPLPIPKPPAPIATPSPDLITVATRIDERLLAMLELLRTLAADVSALKGQLEQVKAHVASLRAEKDAQVAAAMDQMTPDAQAQFDAIKADMAAAAQLAADAASA